MSANQAFVKKSQGSTEENKGLCIRHSQRYFGPSAKSTTTGTHRQGAEEKEGSDLGLSSHSVALGGSGLHIQACVLSGSEAGSKLILTAQNGWHAPAPFGMGGSGSKSTDNTVADTVDNSNNLSKDFAILHLHGGTSALIAGVTASVALFYVAYRLFNWKRAKMSQAA